MFHSNGYRRGKVDPAIKSVMHLDDLMDHTREIFARKFREIDLGSPVIRKITQRLDESGPDLHIDFGLDELEPVEEFVIQRPAM